VTWIKICGITNLDDAQAAIAAGADALGFVFYEKSSRRVKPETVCEIIAKLTPKVERVGVFFNEAADTICETAENVGLTSVQLHGDDEDPYVADQIATRRPHTKVLVAVPMLQPAPESWAMMYRPDLLFKFLLDSGAGTGKAFDWNRAKASAKVIQSLGDVIVAGGLTPDNVGEAISTLHPWGVDVSSGVESHPGKKDVTKMRAFVDAVRAADRLQ
jgi:phosphoribosylanthranilate isomerase